MELSAGSKKLALPSRSVDGSPRAQCVVLSFFPVVLTSNFFVIIVAEPPYLADAVLLVTTIMYYSPP